MAMMLSSELFVGIENATNLPSSSSIQSGGYLLEHVCLDELAVHREDRDLSHWVRGTREKRAALRRKGVEESEESGRYGNVGQRTLTAERIARLDAIGFAWVVDTEPKVPWERRFQELMEYYDENGRWPTQSMGKLGKWVHRMRKLYKTRDENFMRERFQKLDEVGFEWAPRGPRNKPKVDWDEDDV